jgi:hypothetical protein
MANISVKVFDSEDEARAHGEAARGNFIGLTQLGSVDIVDRSGNDGPKDEYFEEFNGKWGVVIIG